MVAGIAAVAAVAATADRAAAGAPLTLRFDWLNAGLIDGLSVALNDDADDAPGERQRRRRMTSTVWLECRVSCVARASASGWENEACQLAENDTTPLISKF